MNRMILMLCAALSLTACAAKKPIVSTPRAACADLVPADWSKGVEGAPIPDNAPVTLGTSLTGDLVAQIIAPWAAAYVDASGRLEKANERTAKSIAIVRNCERLANEARLDK